MVRGSGRHARPFCRHDGVSSHAQAGNHGTRSRSGPGDPGTGPVRGLPGSGTRTDPRQLPDQVPRHHRPQADRPAVSADLLRLLRVGRPGGDADAGRAGPPGDAVPLPRAVQPALHLARRGDAAAVRHARGLRVRQLHRADPDRRAGRVVPPPQRAGLLVVPVRWADGDRRVDHTAGVGRLRLDRLHPAEQRRELPRGGREHVGARPGRLRARHHPRRGQPDHHDPHPARARHDHVPDADLHLEHAVHQPAGDPRLPAAGRRAAGALRRPVAQRARVRRGHRRPDALAAPVLVLRPPRGLHHRVAVLRHHHRDHSGLLPQAALRLHRDRAGHRRASPCCR